MRKRIGMAAQMMVLALMASLASCQSERRGGNATSAEDVTDPNVAFSQGGGAPTKTPNPTPASSSTPRTGNLLQGSDQGNQGR